jgi:hypothetical protein
MSMSVIGSVYDIATGDANNSYMLSCRQVFNKWELKFPRRYEEYVLWDVTPYILIYGTNVSE